MIATISIPTEVHLTHVKMDLAVRYEDEDMPEDYPFRSGDTWSILVNIDNGQIENWPEGIDPLDLYMKVCDEGNYTLITATGTEILEIEGYVPHSLVPGEYGDYIDFKIDGKGMITNWPKQPSIADFYEHED